MLMPVVSDPDDNYARFQYAYEAWLKPSLEFGAFRRPDGTLWVTHDFEHLWNRISSGQALFWEGEQAAFVTEVYQSPTGLRSHHMWLAGGDVDEIVSMVPELEQWGREHGCHRQTGSGRRGWLRKFTGYEEMGVRKQKSLLVDAGGKPIC